MNIELTLSPDYQRNEWGVKEALRELISNALDGQERGRSSGTGQMVFEYSKRTKILSVTNRSTTVPVDALLMGSSRSRENDDCIGQFGEGLPMSLLVLARKGVEVVIYNGMEKWTPVIERSATFGTDVLTVKRRQMIKPREDFTIEVHDLEADEVEEMRKLFLLLDPEFDEEMTISSSYYDKTKVLLQPEYKGRIYNKGVYVTKRDDISFGYDLNAKLNRDRSIIDDYDLRHEIGLVLSGALGNQPEKFVDLVFPQIFSAEGLETGSEYGSLSWDDRFADLVHERWLKAYGPGVVAVRRAEEVEDAQRLGYKGVVTSNLVRKIIDGRLGSLAALQAEHETKVVEYCDHLSPVEETNLYLARKFLEAACPAAINRKVEVVRFGGQKRDFLRQEDIATAFISRSCLADLGSAVRVMARVGADIEGSGTTDQQLDLLSRMVVAVHRREE